jgi:hypothetical protein
MWLPDADTLLRLALLAVALYLLLTVGLVLLPYALAVVVVVGPFVGAVVLVRWLAGELGTAGAVLILTAGVGLGIFAYACARRR